MGTIEKKNLFEKSFIPSSPSSNTPTKSKHRFETSLGQLTRRFIELLKDSQDGVLNLNTASTMLNVQKRRIYDITNVLEGVGLLNKTSKNNIKWNGGSLDSCLDNPNVNSLSLANGNKFGSKNDLERENALLDEKEKALDDAIKKLTNELHRATEDAENRKYMYVTYKDMRFIKEFSDQTVIAIKAPSETKLEVSDPSESLQIHVKSERGEIEVYLCPDDDGLGNLDEGKDDYIDRETHVNDQNEVKDPHTEAGTESGFVSNFTSEIEDLGSTSEPSYLEAIQDHTYGKVKSTSLQDQLIAGSSTSGIIFSSPIAPRAASSMSDLPFLPIEPPLSEEDYNFALAESEGLANLFDDIA